MKTTKQTHFLHIEFLKMKIFDEARSHLGLVFVISKDDNFTPNNYEDENGLWVLNQDVHE
jgi:hypothetical protein